MSIGLNVLTLIWNRGQKSSHIEVVH